MKRIFKKLLLTILVLLPVTVFADMGAPEVKSYKAEIIKEEGADYYNWGVVDNGLIKKGHKDKGTIVEANYEMEQDGVIYIECTDENNNIYYFKSSDIVPVEKELIPDKNIKGISEKKEPEEYKVYQDVEVRKGPSATYESVGKLKKGTIGKYIYYIEESTYIYVEQDGLKGWVDMMNNSVLLHPIDGKILVTGNDIKTDCGTIPLNSIFTSNWKTTNWDAVSNNGGSLIEYNKCETFLPTFKNSEIAYVNDFSEYYVMTGKDIEVYESVNSKKVVGTIPKGSIITKNGYTTENGPGSIYLEYNDIKGWVNGIYYMNDEEAIQNIYPASPEFDKNVLEELKNNLEKEVKIDYKEDSKEETKEDEEEKEEKEDKKEDSKEKKEDKKAKTGNTNDTITMCCIAAVAFALGAIVAIVLVNKNKKDSKKEEQVTEKVEEKEPVEEPKEESEESKEE